MLKYSNYHKRECCEECGWVNLGMPFPHSCYSIQRQSQLDRCCPDCGSENLEHRVGRLIYEVKKSFLWPDEEVNVGFILKDKIQPTLPTPPTVEYV